MGKTMLGKGSLSIILKQALFLTSFLLFILAIQVNTSKEIYDNIYQSYIDRLNTLNSINKHVPPRDMCNAISCVSVYNKNNDVLYVSEYGKLKYSYSDIPPGVEYLGYLNKDLYTVVKYKNFNFYIDDRKIIHDSITSILIIFSVYSFVILLMLFIYISLKYKSNKMKYINIKRELELVAQRDVTEILHHEMNLPVAVITSGIYSLRYDIKHLDFARKSDVHFTSIIENMLKDIDDMLIAIDSINSVLKLIGNNKTIKQTNGNLSILDVFNRAIINCNTFRLGKISYNVESESILKTNSINFPLSNGELYNIFKVLINNAMEAKATEIIIGAEYSTKKNFLKVLLKDNGPGLKDSKGRPLKNHNVIFEYGYSTKSSKTKRKTISEYIISVINWIFNLNINNTNNTGRGYGLYLNKKIIEDACGSITVGHSDRNGTLFVLELPVKKTEIHHNEKQHQEGSNSWVI